MGKIFILLIFFVLMPLRLWAGVEFWKIFPNTVDDASMEYVEFRNTSCEEVDISGYTFSDASGKEYIFPSSTKIASHATVILPRSTSKIILNNEDEILSLRNPAGEMVDEFSYSSSIKGEIIVDVSLVDETCQTEPPTESGATNTGTTQTGSTEPPPIQTGSTQTGSTGTGTPEPPSSSGGLITPPPSASGGTVSGELPPIVDSGSISSGVVLPPGTGGEVPPPSTGGTLPPEGEVRFPEITPTIQSPTNATLSGSSFLCTPNSPCRVNVSFEEIFTGSFLMKDYVCEIITGSGTLTTCNPNTLYFSENSSFGFRLTSKKDMSKMKSQYWNLLFILESTPVQTGATNTGEVASSGVIVFPEILPTFQNYTNTTQSGEYLICTTSPCRLNFTLEPIFTGAFLMRDYTCTIEYGTGVFEACNPPQMYPTGTGQLKISLLHKTSGQSREKIWYFLQNLAPDIIVPGEKPEIIPDKNPPVIVLKFDGKVKGYHEIIGDYEINCYTLTCAVNLTAEDSYDREGSDISFLWYYGLHDIKTSKDPGERKYGLGDHEIWLRVIDALGNMAQVRYKIHVLGPRAEEDKITEKKTKMKKEAKEAPNKKKTSKKKKLKMSFFTPPIVVLQSKKVVSTNEEIYTCMTSTKKCSLNLTLSGAQKGMTYIWSYPDGREIISKNPKSEPFALGNHEIKLSVVYSGSTDVLWQKIFSFSVIKEQKIKKPKKPKKTKQPQKSKNQEEVPLQSLPDEEFPPENPLLPVVFSSTLFGILFLRRIPLLSKFREQ